jgi:hypothetical protein
MPSTAIAKVSMFQSFHGTAQLSLRPSINQAAFKQPEDSRRFRSTLKEGANPVPSEQNTLSWGYKIFTVVR